MKSAVVTGAASGMGAAISRAFTCNGVRVFGGVRRAEDGVKMRERLGELFVPVLLDVTDAAQVERVAAEVGAAIGRDRLFALVNNAGISIPGPLVHQSTKEFEAHLDVNLLGPTRMARAFLPLLGTDPARTGRPGRIINITSMAGKLGVPLFSAYTASKFGVEGFSEALRLELMPFGIDVVVVAPGSVESSIWDKADALDQKRYDATPWRSIFHSVSTQLRDERPRALPADAIGRKVYAAAFAARPRRRYTVARGAWWMWPLIRIMPQGMLERVLAAKVGIVRNAAVAASPAQASLGANEGSKGAEGAA
jgi:NAD(P)-dependent dehydrogenase (short-subunit alcohol dehydrogenase family)